MEELRKARLKSGYRMEDAATTLEIEINTLSRWETGAREPRVETIKRLAKLYGVTPNDLLGID